MVDNVLGKLFKKVKKNKTKFMVYGTMRGRRDFIGILESTYDDLPNDLLKLLDEKKKDNPNIDMYRRIRVVDVSTGHEVALPNPFVVTESGEEEETGTGSSESTLNPINMQMFKLFTQIYGTLLRSVLDVASTTVKELTKFQLQTLQETIRTQLRKQGLIETKEDETDKIFKELILPMILGGGTRAQLPIQNPPKPTGNKPPTTTSTK